MIQLLFLYSTFLFIVGFIGIFIVRKNLLISLMCIEVMLLAVILYFLFLSMNLDDATGEIFALFILAVAAAESSIGLAILVVYYRLRGVVGLRKINLLKG